MVQSPVSMPDVGSMHGKHLKLPPAAEQSPVMSDASKPPVCARQSGRQRPSPSENPNVSASQTTSGVPEMNASGAQSWPLAHESCSSSAC
jgi:hypothetical protein